LNKSYRSLTNINKMSHVVRLKLKVFYEDNPNGPTEYHLLILTVQNQAFNLK
jgi:hypothetical protein